MSGAVWDCHFFESKADGINQALWIEGRFRLTGQCPDRTVAEAEEWLLAHLYSRPHLSMEGENLVIDDRGKITVWAPEPIIPVDSPPPPRIRR